MTESWFSALVKAPPVEVFALIDTYKQDTFEKKVNLGVGGWDLKVNLYRLKVNFVFTINSVAC